jgi:hypothetical protein
LPLAIREKGRCENFCVVGVWFATLKHQKGRRGREKEKKRKAETRRQEATAPSALNHSLRAHAAEHYTRSLPLPPLLLLLLLLRRLLPLLLHRLQVFRALGGRQHSRQHRQRLLPGRVRRRLAVSIRRRRRRRGGAAAAAEELTKPRRDRGRDVGGQRARRGLQRGRCASAVDGGEARGVGGRGRRAAAGADAGEDLGAVALVGLVGWLVVGWLFSAPTTSTST